MAITQERLKELLSYDPLTGVFLWKTPRRHGWVGKRAGCLHHSGYRCIVVDGRFYWAHRLAWVWMTGQQPPPQVDHVDRDKDNNTWLNLRAATASQNRANAKVNSNNRSGLKGVSYFPRHGTWGAYIKKNGHKIWLGSFASPDAAHAAYAEAARQVHGEFARAS